MNHSPLSSLMFQFLIVRLKSIENFSDAYAEAVSIPYSTIKISCKRAYMYDKSVSIPYSTIKIGERQTE